ncbi:MAG: N-acetylmuramoyl-L-alanine amidase [bacterium]|nr:N-acetylmuramoyl-L-alanine amidase [bacterium]
MAFKVAIDAGHGSNTAGKRTCKFTKDVKLSNGTVIKKGQQYREHYANVMVSDFLATELKRCGISVYKSAWDDKDASDDPDISLSTRQKNIKAAKCNISVSNHFNAYGTNWNSAQGIGTFYHSSVYGDSKKLATSVYNQIVKGTSQKKRGIKQQAFAMVNTSRLGVKAAILNEYAFMTNEHEAQDLMANVEYCKECAVEVAKGICNYAGIKYVPEGNTPPAPSPKPTGKVSKSTMVKGLQSALNKDYGTKLDVDGSYGPKTKAALADHNIKSGSKKNSVKWLQTRLNELGYTDGNNKKLDVDGDFGSKTKAALIKLQTKLGASKDGIFGTGTMDRMIKLYK